MLSSRAAAFSVQALLTSPSEESKVGEQLQHQVNEDTPKETPAEDAATVDTHVMTETQDTSVEVTSQEKQHTAMLESKFGATPTLRRTSPSVLTKQEKNLSQWDAGVSHIKQVPGDGGMVESSPVNDEYTDDELVVDVESCSTSPPPSPEEGAGRVSLSHSSISAICQSRCRTPVLNNTDNPAAPPSQHQFREETFPSTSPAGVAEWQVFPQAVSLGVGWTGQESVGEGRDSHNIHLLQQELWTKFHHLSTEMIITKNGRRMFPVVKVRLRGLDPEKTYMVYLDMVAVDTRRYRYVYPSSRWMVAGTGEPMGEQPPYIHPDSPATGVQWMAAPAVAFDRLKLTNNKTRETKGQIVLHSMQKYVPRVWLQEVDAGATWTELPRLVDPRHALHASFPETTFITVTAYQNQQITRLKIDSNPFAKGFRDTTKQKEFERRSVPTSKPQETALMVPTTLMLPLGVPAPSHLQYATPLTGFPPQYSVAGPVSPPVSPLLLPPHWLSGTLEGGDRPLPWLPDLNAAPLLRAAPPGLPFLLPSFLPALHTQLPNALDLSKRKDDT